MGLDGIMMRSGEHCETVISYPVTPTQNGILFQSRHGERGGHYHAQVVLAVHQDLDVGVFRSSWEHASRRHAALRTGIFGGSRAVCGWW
jgi:hypothetical protein